MQTLKVLSYIEIMHKIFTKSKFKNFNSSNSNSVKRMSWNGIFGMGMTSVSRNAFKIEAVEAAKMMK